MFLAALGHDVEHPSTNNAYAIWVKDQRAILYNDKSVLENHHVSLFFQILLQPQNNVFASLRRE